MSDFRQGIKYDFVFIDGGPRADCLFSCIGSLKNGSYIYCDNTDNDLFWHGSFKDVASKIDRISSIQYFTSYMPNMLAVNQGALIKTRD
jgi:hypothetical protein